MTIRTTYFFFFLVALIAGAWPLALPTAQSNPVEVSHAAETVSPAV